MSDADTRLMTDKADLGRTLLVETPLAPLADGEVRLSLDRFALTTNNITYAAYGDAIGYWKVFPSGRDGWGMMPVWGFADVVESRVEAITPGARVYGYFPMAGSLTVRPEKIGRGGFQDASPWRSAVPDIYNRYSLCAADPFYAPELEASEAVFRPLFITSYTAVDFLRDNSFFGARQVVVSSASSKTAYGAAHCMAGDDVRLIGVTGARNRAFVQGLGCYDQVCGYDDIEALPADVPTLYLDLAGDPVLRRRVHAHFGERLAYDCLVGSTQGDAFPQDDPDLVGPPPVFFFAATQLDQHRANGVLRAFLDRFGHDQRAFFQRVVDPASPWIRMVETTGLAGAAPVVRALADGLSDPAEGRLIRLDR